MTHSLRLFPVWLPSARLNSLMYALALLLLYHVEGKLDIDCFPLVRWFHSHFDRLPAPSSAYSIPHEDAEEVFAHRLQKLEAWSSSQSAFASFGQSNCLQNEYFSRCFAYCDRHCPFKTHDGRIVRKPARMCLRICKAGCLCQPGYVRDKRSGHCVLRKTCPYHWINGPQTMSIAANQTSNSSQSFELEQEQLRQKLEDETNPSVSNRIINVFAFFTNLIFS